MSEITLAGSCLCGQVRYRVSGETRAFFHCHCTRCCKASGTGHGSNIILRANHVDWDSGEELIRRYDVPDAERYHTTFCTQCGSPVPRVHEKLSMVVIPAGSLDEEPPIKPQARIFWGSRTDWSCGDSEIQQFDEYPG